MSYFSLDYQQKKEKDVNRNDHEPCLNIETFPFKSRGSSSRCHHVDCGVPLFGDCNGDANEDFALRAMFLSFDPWALTKDKYFYSRSADFTTPSSKS